MKNLEKEIMELAKFIKVAQYEINNNTAFLY